VFQERNEEEEKSSSLRERLSYMPRVRAWHQFMSLFLKKRNRARIDEREGGYKKKYISAVDMFTRGVPKQKCNHVSTSSKYVATEFRNNMRGIIYFIQIKIERRRFVWEVSAEEKNINYINY
jgi:hypothetical protein